MAASADAPISCLSHGTSSSSASVATPTSAACCRKNVGEPARRRSAVKPPPSTPASLLPQAAARNHTPSIEADERSRARACVMVLRPTGLRNSSPTVCRKNSPTSHNGLTRPSAVSIAAGTISRNDSPRKNSPSTNFTGLDGWRAAQPQPQPGEQGREQDHEQRIQRLKPGGRERPAEQLRARELDRRTARW